MSVISKSPKYLLLLALLSGASSGSLAQTQDAPPQQPPAADVSATAYLPAEKTEGPEIKGIISARSGDRMQVTAADGTKSVLTINDETRISASKGFFGLNRSRLAATSSLG